MKHPLTGTLPSAKHTGTELYQGLALEVLGQYPDLTMPELFRRTGLEAWTFRGFSAACNGLAYDNKIIEYFDERGLRRGRAAQ